MQDAKQFASRLHRPSRAGSIASFGLLSDKGLSHSPRPRSVARTSMTSITLVAPRILTFVLAVLSDCGLSDRVQITVMSRWPSLRATSAEDRYCINLRQRTVGETSASLYRIMAASVPAIVSNVGAFAELPNDAVVKIDHDHYTDALLQAYLRKLIEDTQFRLRVGANARRHVLSEHDGKQSAGVTWTSSGGHCDSLGKQLSNKVSTDVVTG